MKEQEPRERRKDEKLESKEQNLAATIVALPSKEEQNYKFLARQFHMHGFH